MPVVGGIIARKSRIMRTLNTSRPTILLVDDDPIILTMLTKFLSVVAPSYDVVALPNGTQALDYLSQRSIALVVTDFNMPGLDGLQLARLVKIQQPGTPVMLISGMVFQSLESEVDSYLVKPFSLMDMQQAVDAVLTPSQQSEQHTLYPV
jgi:DNA-binding response OmpR family regulator